MIAVEVEIEFGQGQVEQRGIVDDDGDVDQLTGAVGGGGGGENGFAIEGDVEGLGRIEEAILEFEGEIGIGGGDCGVELDGGAHHDLGGFVEGGGVDVDEIAGVAADANGTGRVVSLDIIGVDLAEDVAGVSEQPSKQRVITGIGVGIVDVIVHLEIAVGGDIDVGLVAEFEIGGVPVAGDDDIALMDGGIEGEGLGCAVGEGDDGIAAELCDDPNDVGRTEELIDAGIADGDDFELIGEQAGLSGIEEERFGRGWTLGPFDGVVVPGTIDGQAEDIALCVDRVGRRSDIGTTQERL